MTDEKAQKVLDELQGVRPEKLNGEAKRLFEAIMKIVDQRNLSWKVQYAMPEYLAKEDVTETFCINHPEDSDCDDVGRKCEDCIIEYFEKKVGE